MSVVSDEQKLMRYLLWGLRLKYTVGALILIGINILSISLMFRAPAPIMYVGFVLFGFPYIQTPIFMITVDLIFPDPEHEIERAIKNEGMTKIFSDIKSCLRSYNRFFYETVRLFFVSNKTALFYEARVDDEFDDADLIDGRFLKVSSLPYLLQKFNMSFLPNKIIRKFMLRSFLNDIECYGRKLIPEAYTFSYAKASRDSILCQMISENYTGILIFRNKQDTLVFKLSR